MTNAKINFARRLLIVGISSITLLTACTGTYRQESTGQYIDSSAITMKVKSKLLADDYIKSLPITVNTYKNTVQLSGFVDSQTQKERAVGIAKNVQGVVSVKDNLVVKKR